MSISVKAKATPERSITWFEEDVRQVAVALEAPPEPLGEPGKPVAPDVLVAQLLEDAAINASGEPWKAEALLARLTPAVLADMVNDPANHSAVTRQVPLSADTSVEVTVHRMLGEGETLFCQLWVAAF